MHKMLLVTALAVAGFCGGQAHAEDLNELLGKLGLQKSLLLEYMLDHRGDIVNTIDSDPSGPKVDGVQFVECPDGRYIWDQPDGPSGWNEMCGQTAVANIVSDFCEAPVSPNDPYIKEICHNNLIDRAYPGTSTRQLIDVLETYTEKDYEFRPKPRRIVIPYNYEDFANDISRCKVPFLMLYTDDPIFHVGAHYITITRVEEINGISYAYVISFGVEIRMPLDELFKLYKVQGLINSGLICEVTAQNAAVD